MKEVLLHHVSDIHIGSDHHAPVIKPTGEQQDPTLAIRFRSYVEFLEGEAEHRPDLVVLSGDFVSKGNDRHDFETAYGLIERIVEVMNTGRDFSPNRVCLVPGNHDLDWSRDTYEGKIDNFRSVFGRLKGRAAICEVSQSPYFVIPDTNILVYLLNSCSLGGKIKSGFGRIEKTLENAGFDKAKVQGALDLLRSEQRVDPGYVEPADLVAMLKQSQNYQGHLKIAVMHHNLSPAPSDFIDQFSAIINAGYVREYLRDARFDVVLHGHQHHPYCTYEQIVRPDKNGHSDKTNWFDHRYSQGIHIIGAPSLGSSYSSPDGSRWFKIRIRSADTVTGSPPSALIDVEQAREHTTSTYDFHPTYRFSVSKPLSAKLGALHEHLGRYEPLTKSAQNESRDSLDNVLLPILKLRGRLDDWPQPGDSGAGRPNWKANFLGGLDEYEIIFGTDLLGPTGWMHASYLEYIHKQFEQKRRRKHNALELSGALHEAMKRTNWGTRAQRNRVASNVQIARILLWDETYTNDDFGKCVLGMVHMMHQLHDVPVFVLSPSAPGLSEIDRREEFVFASLVGPKNSKCFVYNTDKPNEDTLEIGGPAAAKYFDRFCHLLAQPQLKSIPKILS
ncbi:3',5'-cyclic AMP phosphodiesterase CpdA [Bradyrhizobium elkanii]|uniref:metallophosphoesterase family protein n=1 Tax=Bradyrhizobium elkanii TaxID=29448 RepID=UPI002169D556|nr:3',5'-cyclic AMP phosphodiesterase CpdA [Bradyrhizobium elkanii]